MLWDFDACCQWNFGPIFDKSFCVAPGGQIAVIADNADIAVAQATTGTQQTRFIDPMIRGSKALQFR